MGLKEDRDKRLAELKKSVDVWEKDTVKDLERRAASSKKMLEGRTGVSRLTEKTKMMFENLALQSVNDFLSEGTP